MKPATRTADPRSRFRTDGVATVSQERLVVLLYERLLRDLDDAEAGLAAADNERAHDALVHAQSIVEELAFAVRPEGWSGGASLLDLYHYVLDQLVEANVKKTPDGVAAARLVIERLHDAWREAYQSLQVSSLGEAG